MATSSSSSSSSSSLFCFLSTCLLWSCVHARHLATAPTGAASPGRPGSLRRLLAEGLDSCAMVMDNVDYPSDNNLNWGPNSITASSAECCQLCNRHPDCKSWTRIKTARTWNLKGECWLRDHIPKAVPCTNCESGVAKSVDEHLEGCVAEGEQAAELAVRGACTSLTRLCPSKNLTARSAFFPGSSHRLAEVTERTCDALFEDACIRGGFDKAIAGNDDCSSILINGPDEKYTNSDCPDFKSALEIFESLLRDICVG